MKEYEVIREIPNSCSGNQMRDVFFDEIECDSPMEYVLNMFPGKQLNITEDTKPDGSLLIYAEADGLINKFTFTEI